MRGVHLLLNFMVVDMKAGHIDAFFNESIRINLGMFGERGDIVMVEGPSVPRTTGQ